MARFFGKKESATPRSDGASDEQFETQSDGDATSSPTTSARDAGPWDSTERDTADDPHYVDLGALRIRGRVGTEIRLQSEEGEQGVAAALVITDDAALELRVFAGPRSGGIWPEVLSEMRAQVEQMEGQADEVAGRFGPELHVRLPVTLDDGQAGVQPTRIVGIEGPRWLLRATFLGTAALEPSDEGLLADTLADVVVVRGDAPMMAREPLPLTVPESAVAVGVEETETPDDAFSDDARGGE